MKEHRVREILSEWFRNQGYEVNEKAVWLGGPKIDIVAESKTQLWIVEVKGDYDKDPAQYSVNFDTGMGQLLKSIIQSEKETKYGIAIPFSRTEAREQLSYRLILPKYSKSLVFERLNIYLILVCDDKFVKFINPRDVNDCLRRYSEGECLRVCKSSRV